MILATIDPYILAFSAVTVFATVFMGFWSAKKSKTAGDFFVAGRSVSVGWNASAISGEYLSAASFMGVAGMVMSSGYDALWYPVCYACGYLFLLLFIAGPLRRFGAYTIPDFAEGRYDSPLFRKIAVCFVLFIGFFYTMPQMKGAGVTLAYIFPGLPYWVGVVLVGAVITLNVALGGMKGITLVQAFQYWAKMFAISVPIFVLMAVYGNYGKQLRENSSKPASAISSSPERFFPHTWRVTAINGNSNALFLQFNEAKATVSRIVGKPSLQAGNFDVFTALRFFAANHGHHRMLMAESAPSFQQMTNPISVTAISTTEKWEQDVRVGLRSNGVDVIVTASALVVVPAAKIADYEARYRQEGSAAFIDATEMISKPLSEKAPTDSSWLSLSETGAADRIAVSTSMSLTVVNGWVTLNPPRMVSRAEERLKAFFGQGQHYAVGNAKLVSVLFEYTELSGRTIIAHTNVGLTRLLGPLELNWNDWGKTMASVEQFLATNGVALRTESANTVRAMTREQAVLWDQQAPVTLRRALPEKAPADSTWISPFGPLTTKAAKAAKPEIHYDGELKEETYELHGGGFEERAKWFAQKFSGNVQGLGGQKISARTLIREYGINSVAYDKANINGTLTLKLSPKLYDQEVDFPGSTLIKGGKGVSMNEVVSEMARIIQTNGITLVRESGNVFKAFPTKDAKIVSIDPRPYSLLYTYSLIIALVCGTAGLPHILVRFYTNPDGVAAKRTTMWVMILIGIFYVFPPVFGVLGRNLMPDLYNGLTGVKGTDGIVLKLPTILREKYGVLGSILSGITCAGAFAAFMSTFSGLLVSMTGALAHDVYGRILRPKSTPEQRLRMFKFAAVLIGGVAIVLGSFVEPLEINFMVGQAFAIAAASYFPLLFMSVWWRGMTMRGAATGMLAGGLCALAAVTLTNFSNLALDKGPMGKVFAGFAPLNDFWAHHPLLRILCEQPAIWTVPLAIGLMIVVGKLTRKDVPSDVRMKMLVLHAPEKLGLKQEYIQEHQHGH